MSTFKQKSLAKTIIKNAVLYKPLNAGEMLEKVGYSKSVADAKAKDIIQSVGVQNALAEYGFTEDNAKKVVTDILLDDNQRAETRLKAAEQVFKVQGSYAPEKVQTVNIDIKIDDTDAEAIRAEYETKLQDKLKQNDVGLLTNESEGDTTQSEATREDNKSLE